MLTILAWTIFVPALFWNVVFWVAAMQSTLEEGLSVWSRKKNQRDVLLSVLALFIPGVYLFGIF